MLVLTLAVWTYMYVRRLHFLHTNRVDPQSVNTPSKAAGRIPDEVGFASDNFKNLFELPVAFYALCLYLYVTGNVDALYVYAAWAFLVFRGLHSLVHCTVNRVMLRFGLYVLAAAALWFMLMRAVVSSLV